MDEADKSLEAYDKLQKNIPSIGILNRRKRAVAFFKVSKVAQKMIDNEEISEDNALYLLSVLTRKNSDFQKSAMMVALNLPKMDRTALRTIGFTYANNMRCNMQMMPVDNNE